MVRILLISLLMEVVLTSVLHDHVAAEVFRVSEAEI
jgi:hypothetical protein